MKSPLIHADASHPWNVAHVDAATAVVTKSGTWSTISEPTAMGLSYIQSETVGDYAQLIFQGVGLWAYVYRAADAGKVKVYIDGTLTQTIDLYTSSSQRTVLWLAVGLEKVDTLGNLIDHTCKLEAETKNPSSGGNKVNIDGFEIEVDPGALQVLAFLEQTLETVGTVTYGDIIPDNDLQRHLGSAAKRWLDLFVQDIYFAEVAATLPTTEGQLRYVDNALRLRDNLASRTLAVLNLAQTFTEDQTFENILAAADALYDIGASATRFRDAFLSSSLRIGTTPASVGLLRLPNNQSIAWRNAANTGDLTLALGTDNRFNFQNQLANSNTVVQIIPKGSPAVITGLFIYRTDYIADAVNWEALDFYYDGTTFLMDSEAGGTGVVRSIEFQFGGTTVLGIPSATQINARNIYPLVDATYDLGSSALRFRDAYLSSSLRVGTTPASAGAIRLPNVQNISWRNAGDTADIVGIYVDANNRIALEGGDVVLSPSGAGSGTGKDIMNYAEQDFLTFLSTAAPVGTDRAYGFYTGSGLTNLLTIVNAGHVTPGSDNAQDIGSATLRWRNLYLASLRPGDDNLTDLGSAALRWRDGYFGTSVRVGTNPATAGAIRLQNNLYAYWRNGANTANILGIGVDGSDWIRLGTHVLISGDCSITGIAYPTTNKAYSLGTAIQRWSTLYEGTSTAAGTSRIVKAKKNCPSCQKQMWRGTGSLVVLGADRDWVLCHCLSCGCAGFEELQHLPKAKLSAIQKPSKIEVVGVKVGEFSGNSRYIRVDFKYGEDRLDEQGNILERGPHNSTYLGELEIEEFQKMTEKERERFLYELGLREWEALEQTKLMQQHCQELEAEFTSLIAPLKGTNLAS